MKRKFPELSGVFPSRIQRICAILLSMAGFLSGFFRNDNDFSNSMVVHIPLFQ